MLKKKDCVACGYCELAGQLSIRTRILLPEKTNTLGVSMYVRMYSGRNVQNAPGGAYKSFKEITTGRSTYRPTNRPTNPRT